MRVPAPGVVGQCCVQRLPRPRPCATCRASPSAGRPQQSPCSGSSRMASVAAAARLWRLHRRAGHLRSPGASHGAPPAIPAVTGDARSPPLSPCSLRRCHRLRRWLARQLGHALVIGVLVVAAERLERGCRAAPTGVLPDRRVHPAAPRTAVRPVRCVRSAAASAGSGTPLPRGPARRSGSTCACPGCGPRRGTAAAATATRRHCCASGPACCAACCRARLLLGAVACHARRRHGARRPAPRRRCAARCARAG